ncbi:MAG: hypothetical protein ABSF29_12470 [Tepidisphaeraceae bacterium]
MFPVASDLIQELIQFLRVIGPRAERTTQSLPGRRRSRKCHGYFLTIGQPRRLLQFDGLSAYCPFEYVDSICNGSPRVGIPLSLAVILTSSHLSATFHLFPGNPSVAEISQRNHNPVQIPIETHRENGAAIVASR